MCHCSLNRHLGLVLFFILPLLAIPPAHGHETDAGKTPGIQLVALAPTITTAQLEKIVLRLKQTPAIGTFKKLDLQYRLDELRRKIEFYDSGEPAHDSSLRRQFDRLVNELLAHLQERDRPLYQDVARARHALWQAVVKDRWDQ